MLFTFETTRTTSSCKYERKKHQNKKEQAQVLYTSDGRKPELGRRSQADMAAAVARLHGGGKQPVSNTISSQNSRKNQRAIANDHRKQNDASTSIPTSHSHREQGRTATQRETRKNNPATLNIHPPLPRRRTTDSAVHLAACSEHPADTRRKLQEWTKSRRQRDLRCKQRKNMTRWRTARRREQCKSKGGRNRITSTA